HLIGRAASVPVGRPRLHRRGPNARSVTGRERALTAAKIVDETANISRFGSEACFARYAAVAPIPASSRAHSASPTRPGGNPPFDAARHRIAVTHIRLTEGLGQAY